MREDVPVCSESGSARTMAFGERRRGLRDRSPGIDGHAPTNSVASFILLYMKAGAGVFSMWPRRRTRPVLKPGSLMCAWKPAALETAGGFVLYGVVKKK